MLDRLDYYWLKVFYILLFDLLVINSLLLKLKRYNKGVDSRCIYNVDVKIVFCMVVVLN